MRQLFSDEHAIVLTDDQVQGEIGRVWYLNHHMVCKNGKTVWSLTVVVSLKMFHLTRCC